MLYPLSYEGGTSDRARWEPSRAVGWRLLARGAPLSKQPDVT